MSLNSLCDIINQSANQRQSVTSDLWAASCCVLVWSQSTCCWAQSWTRIRCLYLPEINCLRWTAASSSSSSSSSCCCSHTPHTLLTHCSQILQHVRDQPSSRRTSLEEQQLHPGRGQRPSSVWPGRDHHRSVPAAAGWVHTATHTVTHCNTRCYTHLFFCGVVSTVALWAVAGENSVLSVLLLGCRQASSVTHWKNESSCCQTEYHRASQGDKEQSITVTSVMTSLWLQDLLQNEKLVKQLPDSLNCVTVVCSGVNTVCLCLCGVFRVVVLVWKQHRPLRPLQTESHPAAHRLPDP